VTSDHLNLLTQADFVAGQAPPALCLVPRINAMTLDPNVTYFPDPEDSELVPFAIAFARMMLAHAQFEARIRAVQGLVSGDPTFGEQRKNQWYSDQRAERMAKLIETQLGQIPETKDVVQCLTKSVALSRERNLLAHGEWWAFDPKEQIVFVRSGTDRPNEDQHQERSVADIQRTTDELKNVEAELYMLQSRIESRSPEAG